LQSLDCSRTQVCDLTPLQNLTALQSLDCSSTQVSDLTPLAKLQQLQLLDCSSTQVSDLTPLKKITALQNLDCSNIQIENVPEWLVRLPNLEDLSISGEKIKSIPPEVLSKCWDDNCLDRLRAHF
jgi:internalin A